MAGTLIRRHGQVVDMPNFPGAGADTAFSVGRGVHVLPGPAVHGVTAERLVLALSLAIRRRLYPFPRVEGTRGRRKQRSGPGRRVRATAVSAHRTRGRRDRP